MQIRFSVDICKDHWFHPVFRTSDYDEAKRIFSIIEPYSLNGVRITFYKGRYRWGLLKEMHTHFNYDTNFIPNDQS